MAKFKIGDKVRVRMDLATGINYGIDTFVSSMEKYRGELVTIADYNFGLYSIEEDGGRWNWTDEMFEPVQENTHAD